MKREDVVLMLRRGGQCLNVIAFNKSEGKFGEWRLFWDATWKIFGKVRNVFGKWGSFCYVWTKTEITNVLQFGGNQGHLKKYCEIWGHFWGWNLSEVTTFRGWRQFWNMNSLKVRTCLEHYDTLRRGGKMFLESEDIFKKSFWNVRHFMDIFG